MQHFRAGQTLLLAFCGPGASGKSTLCRELCARDRLVKLSVSTTTRAPRGKERDGVEYHFVSEDEFSARLKAGKFLEYAAFAGKRYGTEKQNIEEAEKIGADLLFDIEYQGAAQLKKLFGSRAITIFVIPPSFAALEERFRSRGTDSEERIQERLKIASEEIQHLSADGASDYFIVNDNLEDSVKLAQAILQAERVRFSRFTDAERAAILARK